MVFSVCVKTVKRFADTLDDATKKDHKKIEAEFKSFCKKQKNKEHRFVSKTIVLFCGRIHYMLILIVLLFGRSGRISDWHFE